jgi:hypothetical protein
MKMKVSEDYAGKTMSAKWLATTLKNHNRKELVATIESVRKHQFDPKEPAKYVLSFVGKEMEAAINKTNAFALANDLGDDADSWPGNKVALSTTYGQTPNGMGHIMQMGGVPTEQKAVSHAPPVTEPTKANGADNAYAAASQSAKVLPTDTGSGAALDDEIPF